MRIEFHGDEWIEGFGFKAIPDGQYRVRASAIPQDGEPFEAFDFEWPVGLRDGTLYAQSVNPFVLKT